MSSTFVDRQQWRLDARGERWFDVLLVLGLLLPFLLAALLAQEGPWAVLGVVQIGPLLWRRRHAAAVFAAVALASAAQVVWIDTPLWSQVAFPVATYSVARFAAAGAGFGALAVGVVAALVAAVDWLHGYGGVLSTGAVAAYFLPIVAIVVTSWALGTMSRTRRAYVDSLVERTAQGERARIARELHDVVAHGLTVMVVQADGARYAAEHDPRVATDTLARIAATGREALGDMRQLLGLLRADDTGTAPLPGLRDLPALVEGAPAVAHLAGLERDVPSSVGLTAYRIVQESLTNVRKHAGTDATAEVRVAVLDGVVDVEVTDDGRGTAAGGPDQQGHGLVGMRERVAVHGGSLDVGPVPGHGWRVRARVPW